MREIRAFLAVELPPGVRTRCARIADRLRSPDCRVGFVDEANLHLTLLFLGEVTLEVASRIGRRIADAVAEQPAFTLHLAGVGAFPTVDRPRTIWVGADEGVAEIRELHRVMAEALAVERIAIERRTFVPHITLGRVRGTGGDGTADLTGRIEAEAATVVGDVPVDEVVLFQSELSRAAPVYTPLGRFPLNG